MKQKRRTIIKTILTLIAICLLLFGGIGFLLSALGSMGTVGNEKYYKQHPLNEKNGIAVDSHGNIYIGEGQTGSIQVYDSLGNFQYGFSFPTGGGGWFVFGIDQDEIHIVTARTDSYFVYDNGELVYSEKDIDYDYSQELQEKYHMVETNSFEVNNRIYEITTKNTIRIQDKLNNKIEKIKLAVPIWPLPVFVFWIIAAIGMGLIFILHHKFLRAMVKY